MEKDKAMRNTHLGIGIFIFSLGLFGIYFQGIWWGEKPSLGNYNESNIIGSLYLSEITTTVGLFFLALYCVDTEKTKRHLLIMFSIATLLVFIAGYLAGLEAVELLKKP